MKTDVNVGMHQGSVLSHMLFIVVLEAYKKQDWVIKGTVVVRAFGSA